MHSLPLFGKPEKMVGNGTAISQTAFSELSAAWEVHKEG